MGNKILKSIRLKGSDRCRSYKPKVRRLMARRIAYYLYRNLSGPKLEELYAVITIERDALLSSEIGRAMAHANPISTAVYLKLDEWQV